METKKIFLRGHHLACFMLFEGKGYSKKFVENMIEILVFVKKNRKIKCIELVSGDDDICGCCPRVDNLNFCALSERTKLHDELYLKLYGLKIGDSLSFDEMSQKFSCLVNDYEFKRICGDCDWFKFCCSIREKKKLSG